MSSDEVGNRSLQDYKSLEIEFHMDLMNCCRKYLNDLGIISILGIIDLVKQETIELERATKKYHTDYDDESKEKSIKDITLK